MTVFDSVLFFVIISKTYLAIHALSGEGIITTKEAHRGQFPYQAAIMGKENGSLISALQCSAVIISNNHLLGAAQCFIDEYGNHKALTFSAVVDEINIYGASLILRDILRIYLPTSGSYVINDISVSELRYSLNLGENPNLSKAEIPMRHPGCHAPPGLVSGYGYNWFQKNYEKDSRGFSRRAGIRGDTDGKLRYEKVGIITDRYCARLHRRETAFYFCGLMYVSSSDSPTRQGLCVLDYGSPLVVVNSRQWIVVGVASTNHNNCDDETFGGLYTNVGANYEFINGILEGSHKPGTLVYDNRPHEMGNAYNATGASFSSLTIY